MIEVPRIEGRSCAGCTLCCKVLSITELEKPQGAWCKHADIGRGCRIYADRPDECRHFYCGYLTWQSAGEHWRPSKCKMVLVAELEGKRVAIHVDTSRPRAWRDEPFYSDLREWATFAAEEQTQIVVYIGARAIVILPDRDVDLGIVLPDERIITFETRGPAGDRQLEAMKLKADDPRIAGMLDGKPFKPSNALQARTLAAQLKPT